MPDDPIFPQATGPTPGPKPNGTPEAAPKAAPDPNAELRGQIKDQQDQIAGLSNSVQQLTQQLARALQAPAQRPAEPAARPDAKTLLDRIATEPDRVLDETVERAVKQAQESGGQMDAVTLAALHKVVHSQHQRHLTEQFGADAYAKHFKPELDRNYSQLRDQGNLAALADPETLKALSDRIIGANMKELRAAEDSVAKSRTDAAEQERAKLIEGLPIPGLVRSNEGGTGKPAVFEGDDAKLFSSELRAATGEAPNMDHLAKVHGANDLSSYLKAVGKPAEQTEGGQS